MVTGLGFDLFPGQQLWCNGRRTEPEYHNLRVISWLPSFYLCNFWLNQSCWIPFLIFKMVAVIPVVELVYTQRLALYMCRPFSFVTPQSLSQLILFSEGDKSLMMILESWENSAPHEYLMSQQSNP